MARGKVITTHLRTGDPNGIRTVFISNKICEMIVFPKSEFDMVSQLEESSRPALYILLGEDENGAAQAYIGETTNGVQRINNHKSHKLFWNKCLMFVAKDNSINKADVLYLERKSIEGGDNLFHITVRECNAHGIFNETDHSMRILKGSLLPQSTVPSYRDGEKRNAIIAAMSKPTKDGFWELQRDYVLASPSTAASYFFIPCRTYSFSEYVMVVTTRSFLIYGVFWSRSSISNCPCPAV